MMSHSGAGPQRIACLLGVVVAMDALVFLFQSSSSACCRDKIWRRLAVGDNLVFFLALDKKRVGEEEGPRVPAGLTVMEATLPLWG